MGRTKIWKRASVAASMALVAMLGIPTAAGSSPAPGRPAVLSILPAGENGLLAPGELPAYEENGTPAPDSQNQLGPYAALEYGDQTLTDSELTDYFEPETMGIPSDPVRVEHPDPSASVTIYRDANDVPYIYGASLDAMAYGAGFAAAEDRLFLMDVLRHYAEGQLSAFLGPSCAFEEMDYSQLLTAAYTKAQLQAQLDALPRRYGALGQKTLGMIDAYVQGVNRYIADTRTDPNMLPADYAAAVGPPTNWAPTDVVAVSSLIGAVATSGGDGIIDAGLLDYLQSKLGTTAGAAAFTAFKEQNNPSAPVSLTNKSFPYMVPGPVDPALNALPDNPSAPIEGTPTDTTPGCALPVSTSSVPSSTSSDEPALTTSGTEPASSSVSSTASSRSPVPPKSAPTAPSASSVATSITELLRPDVGESNAVVIDAAHSATGHPIAVFGPELGYYSPQILMEEDLHAPGYAAAGAAFPGASFVIAIGRTANFAWSATTASAQQTDQRMELICNPEGATPSATGRWYMFDGKCLPMTEHDYVEAAVPKPGGQGAPAIIDHRIFTTVHGIVQGWTTVGGRPVAVVNQRSTYGHEADSFVGLLRWGMPSLTYNASTFIAGADDITYSFNWFYVDDHAIAYVVSGLDPVRPSDVDANLPMWGTGDSEWTGMLSPAGHPHEIDPAQGYFVSWNNKPAAQFSASDDLFGWGPVYRSQLLTGQLQSALTAHDGKLDEAQVVGVVEEAATQDLSATATAAQVMSALGASTDPKVEAMEAQLKPWLATGAHRRKTAPGDAQYADAAAVAIWDETYPLVIEAVFGPLFSAGGTISYEGLAYSFSVLPMPFADTPNAMGVHQGDGYYTGWEGYLDTALAQAAGRAVGEPFPPAVLSRLCGTGPSSCPHAIDDAFDSAYNALVTANGGSTDVAAWTADTATETASAQTGSPVTMPEYDNIVYEAVGIASPAPQDWQNRPTFQQVVSFP